ncbi:Uncharacterised protein [Mycobacteroides abscessus subsp. abscessus]|nr:Uncharacterised protein [Mycobacteroides abscessus subsp. abscessus]
MRAGSGASGQSAACTKREPTSTTLSLTNR